jgi:hypothetical protein
MQISIASAKPLLRQEKRIVKQGDRVQDVEFVLCCEGKFVFSAQVNSAQVNGQKERLKMKIGQAWVYENR